MKRFGKVMLLAVLFTGLVSAVFAADKNQYTHTFHKPGSFDFTLGLGWVGWGIGATAQADYTIGNFNIGFGPINYNIGLFAGFGTYLFGFTGTGFYFDFAVGPMASLSWSLKNIVPDNDFLSKLEFLIGIGVGFYYDSWLAYWNDYLRQTYGTAYTGLLWYSPVVFLWETGVRYHFSDKMSIGLQETYGGFWASTVNLEFKF